MAAKTGFKQQCPHCNALVPVKDDSLIGKRMKCPKCGDPFLVEDPEDETPKSGRGSANNKAAKGKPGTRRQRDEDDDNGNQPRFKKKTQGNSTLILCLGLGGAAVVLLAVAGYFIFFNEPTTKKAEPSPSPGPAARSGPSTPLPGGDTAGKSESTTLTAPTPVAGSPISNMLPNDTQAVMTVAMSEVLKNPLGNMALNSPAFSQAIGFPIDSIEQLIIAGKNTEPQWQFLILRTKTPIQMESVQQALKLKPATETPPHGQTYFMAPFTLVDLVSSFVPPEMKAELPPANPLAVRLHDSTTLVMADMAPMQAFLAAKGQFKFQTQDPAPAAAAQNAPSPELPGGRKMAPVPGPVIGGASGGAPAAPVSNTYRTISPRLKTMLDLMETNKPYLFSSAEDVDGNPRLKEVMENPVIAGVLKGAASALGSFKASGMSFQFQSKDKSSAWLALEFATEQDATSFKQFVDQQLPVLETLSKGIGIKIEKGATSGIQLPGGARPGGGGPAFPGGGGLPGGGKMTPPGVGGPQQPPATGGQPVPGSPTGPGGTKPDVPTVVTLTYDVKLNGKLVMATVDIKLDQKIIDQVYEQAQPYLARAQGEVEMASTRPHPYLLGQGAKAYAEKNKHFPPGIIKRAPSGRRASRPWPPDQQVSGLAELLPFLGQEALYKKINTKESWRDPVNLPAASTLVPQFLSPDLPRSDWFVRVPGLNLDLAATSYVGIAGVGLDAAEYKAGEPASAKKMGIFGYNRSMPLSDIDDAANTILLIQVPPTPKAAWIAGGGSTVRGVPETKSVEPFLTQRSDGKRGAYMVMADSSVRWVTEQISDEVFKQLAQVKGSKTGDLDEVAPKVSKPPNLPELKATPTLPATAAISTPAGSTTAAAAPAPPASSTAPSAPAPNSPRTAAEKKKAANDLKELALAYHSFLDSHQGKPPANLEDLATYFDKGGTVLQAMKEGKYVFLYGVGLQAMPMGSANTVLAYEKDVPTRGGQVVMADGSVKDMTAKEFEAAPKAK
jgi:hypothetical protein